MTENQKAICRELLELSYGNGFNSYPLKPIAAKLGITDILYDKNTETGILWELGAFGSGVIAVTDNGRGLYAGVMRDTHEQLEAWCSK